MKAALNLHLKVFSIFLLVYAVQSLPSCKKNDWYDVKSDKQLSVPSTLKDLQALLDNGSAMNTFTPAMGEIGSDGHYLSDTRASTLTGYNRNAYTWSHEQPNERVIDWMNGNSSGSYKRVYYSNLVLDGLKNIHPDNSIDQERWNNVKGQALFHRAHAFYELAQVFAPPFNSVHAINKLGIPLRLESDINLPTIRYTLKQTYDQITHDLLLAKELLPAIALYKTRPSKVAIYALLSRVYLGMEDYLKSGEYANLCLTEHDVLLDYNTLNANTTNNPFPAYHSEIMFYSIMGSPTALNLSNVLIEQNLYNSYHANDLRKKIFFNRNATTGDITYKGTYAGPGFTNCFSGLATDEIFLIRAECNAREGNTASAMSDINKLLKTRWSGTYTNITASNSEEALRIILEERKKELILRGLRWSDLRRLNRDSRFQVTLRRTVSSVVYTLSPNGYNYTFPIPDDVIEMTDIPQNEGW